MYPNLTHLGRAYFHQDFPEEVDEPIEAVESFRDAEPPEAVDGLRAEIGALLEPGRSEQELSRIWLTDAGSNYDPADDGVSVRQWLLDVLAALDDDAGSDDERAVTDRDAGIPFKGSPGA